MRTYIVEMTIDGSVKPVKVMAESRDLAKDAAELKHPQATRIYNAYTVAEWCKLCQATNDFEPK
jgi:hypothetical protein